jgi:hypothetical protein
MAMSAQTFNGVRVGGNSLRPSIVNRSDKPLIGYVGQRIGDSGYGPVASVVDFDSLAVGKAIQPGEEHPLDQFNVIRIASSGQAEGALLRYDLNAVLFADGEFYGPDEIFQDFSERISTVRSLALGVPYDENKYESLAQHVLSPLEIFRRMRTATLGMRSLEADSTVASTILDIRSKQGDQEADAALARLAALSEVWKRQ